MDSINTTLITHIYNEEYLLPFWLEHHKNMFDDIIIIDYNSTDNSIDICKTICPNCKILKTKNEKFDASDVDKEIMEIENNINGIKMVLNTTEFLFCEKPINNLFNSKESSFSIKSFASYSINTYENIESYKDLISSLLNDDVKYHLDKDRGTRTLHNFRNGNYGVGRHATNNNSSETDEFHIIWLGYFPMNQKTIKRKLQIKNNIPDSNKELGLGRQHFLREDEIKKINNENYHSGSNLNKLNSSLYNLLEKYNTKEGFVDFKYNFIETIMYTLVGIFIIFICLFLTFKGEIYKFLRKQYKLYYKYTTIS
jgi:hypothetical protein